MSKKHGTVFSIKNKNNELFEIKAEKEEGEEDRWYYNREWTCLIFSWDFNKNNMAVYINGNKIEEKIINGKAKGNSKKLIIGGAKYSFFKDTSSFNGKLDELMIYDEIFDIYNMKNEKNNLFLSKIKKVIKLLKIFSKSIYIKKLFK